MECLKCGTGCYCRMRCDESHGDTDICDHLKTIFKQKYKMQGCVGLSLHFVLFPSWRLIICAGNYQPKLLDLYLCHPAIPPRPAYCTNPNEGTKDNWWLIPTNRIIIIIIIFIYIVFFMDDCLHLYDFYVEFNYRYSIYLYSCINTVKRVLNFAANSLLQLCVCTVIFDAGLGASSDSWFLVYQEISKFTKVTSLWNWIIICLFIGPAIK